MARHTDTLIWLGVAAGGAALVYHVATSGQLAQLTAGTPLAAVTGGSTPGNNVIAGDRCPGPYAQLASLVQANPQFVGLMNSWKTGAWQNIDYPSNPNDWGGFRTYVTRLGYPDPGSQPPASFCAGA